MKIGEDTHIIDNHFPVKLTPDYHSNAHMSKRSALRHFEVQKNSNRFSKNLDVL